MKKLCLFLFLVGFVSVNSIDARSTVDALDGSIQTSVTADQYNLDVIIEALEKLGFEIEKLEVSEAQVEEKKCKITLKGTYKGEEIDLTITIEGQTCAEFFKSLL